MIPIIGNISLIFSLLFVVLQVIAPPRFYRIGAVSVFFLVLTSFLCLIYSYVTSDFSVLNVYNNSSLAKPLLYKITGAWGNHEGSMLLLILILCGYNLRLVGRWSLVVDRNNDKLQTINDQLSITAYLTQLLITAGFLSFIIITSNPFERIFPVPINGLGLNPLLQDVGLAIHPPMLYLGYIGFSIAFSYAIAALIHGEADAEWAKTLKKWVLTSWGFLTLGIGLGSWWAYRELGWGGFWFWDPVENVSIIPWLAATGLYHSLIVLEKRGTFAVWSVLLAIITFCLSLIGIFLVRSGIVSSVHSFASDPSRGVFILGFIGLTGACAFFLFALRGGKLASNAKFPILSRETMMLFNNLFFITLSATVLLGTIYPIILEVISGVRVSVGAPYFNATFNSIAMVMLVFASFVPVIKWGKKENQESRKLELKKFIFPITASIISAVLAKLQHADILTIIAIFVATFLFLATAQISFNYKQLPLRAYAVIIAHCGAAVLVAGIAITSCFGIEKEQILYKGEKMEFAGYEAILVDGKLDNSENYVFRQAHFRILKDGNEITNLYPEIRVYPTEGSSTIEAAIYYTLFSNIYAAIGEVDPEGIKYATRIYYKPMINLIWLGCIMMAGGGFLAAWGKKKLPI